MAKHMKPSGKHEKSGKKEEGAEIVRIFDEEPASRRDSMFQEEEDGGEEDGRTMVFGAVKPPEKRADTVVFHAVKPPVQNPDPPEDETGRSPNAVIEYVDEEEEAEAEEKLRLMKVPKLIYRLGAILLVVILGLGWWLNRDSLTLQNIWNWVRYQFVGSEVGDGFPVPITGSLVEASNFTAYNGDAYVLSDTALTVLDSTGREKESLRHSLNRPALRCAYGKALLYNAGSTGYTMLSGRGAQVSGTAERDILTGAVTQNGRYALGVQGSDGASELYVYLEDGNLQYHYLFAKDYITAIALNYDGTHGAICTVATENGQLLSKVTVCDFMQTEPIAVYESADNVLLDAFWTEGGELYVVGDSALLTASSADYQFTEHSYEGRQLTAYALSQGRAFLSLSYYEHAGPCTLTVFRREDTPVRIESDKRIVSLSVSGGTVAALAAGDVRFFDYSTGMELGSADAGADAKGIALVNERTAYVLGVSEVRMIQFQSDGE